MLHFSIAIQKNLYFSTILIFEKKEKRISRRKSSMKKSCFLREIRFSDLEFNKKGVLSFF